ncbi:MAG: hypothetical protein M3310_02625, partial [Actinomycetota bacterium]|nr:hypothetical protein [Actinomycetota bacterium]
YALMNARNPDLPMTGYANAWAFWEATSFLSGVTKCFDLEGSVIEPIEHFLRSFGGRLTPYFRVTRMSRRSWPLSLRRWFRNTRAQVPDAAARGSDEWHEGRRDGP